MHIKQEYTSHLDLSTDILKIFTDSIRNEMMELAVCWALSHDGLFFTQ